MQAFFTLLSKIQKEEFSPFYLLSGNESFYIDAILKALTNKLVNEASSDFDYTFFTEKKHKHLKLLKLPNAIRCCQITMS
jgi:DNA polymerase III delta subunit